MKTLYLNIYDDDGNAIKTYTAETFRLKTGTVIRLFGLVQNLLNEDGETDVDDLAVVAGIVDDVKPLLKSVFKGITDDELENTDFNELVPITMDVLKYAFKQIEFLNDHKKKEVEKVKPNHHRQTSKRRYFN